MRLISLFLVIVAGLAVLGGIAVMQPALPLMELPAQATRQPAPEVPVVVDVVRQRDVPITLSGIGVVAAFNTVTVRSRVDGELRSLGFAEGQFVNAGDVLAQIDSRPFEATLRQTTATLHHDQARLANAKADLDRFSTLARNSFASRQSVDTQTAAVEQIQADIESDQAQIDNASLRLQYTTIRSPISGRVGFRLVDVGNIVDATDHSGIVVVAQQEPIAVLFTLPEEDLPGVNSRLADNQKLQVTVTGRDDKAVLATGEVETIDNTIDQHTATFKVKALFPNADHTLWPGQFVRARLLLTTRHNGTVVPAEVVQRGPDGAFAYVVLSDDTVEMRPITVARIEDGVALIDHGLALGEHVVVDGQYRLRPGIHVRVVAAPAS